MGSLNRLSLSPLNISLCVLSILSVGFLNLAQRYNVPQNQPITDIEKVTQIGCFVSNRAANFHE